MSTIQIHVLPMQSWTRSIENLVLHGRSIINFGTGNSQQKRIKEIHDRYALIINLPWNYLTP